MAMLDLVREVKSGKMKLADVDPGIRRQVQRLLPVVGEAPRPVAPRMPTPGPRLNAVKSA